jgi:hypothetical protein
MLQSRAHAPQLWTSLLVSTHAPTVPASVTLGQQPAVPPSGVGQMLLQPPQWFTSVVESVQSPVQHSAPVKPWVVQSLPQRPQLRRSAGKKVHAPPVPCAFGQQLGVPPSHATVWQLDPQLVSES